MYLWCDPGDGSGGSWGEIQGGGVVNPPDITSVDLVADTPLSPNRFTNESFTVTPLLQEYGTPPIIYSMKAKVKGTLSSQAISDEITAVDPNIADLPATSWSSTNGTVTNPTYAFNGRFSTTTAGGGNNATSVPAASQLH